MARSQNETGSQGPQQVVRPQRLMKEKLEEFEKIFLSFTPEERDEAIKYLRRSAINRILEEIKCKEMLIEELQKEIDNLDEWRIKLQVFP
jgi:signal recognition particle GTPase